MSIKNLVGYQVLDSRGRPTVAVTLTMSDGSIHTARVPSGASTGAHEAKELRDTDSKLAEKFYGGKSVYQAGSQFHLQLQKLLHTLQNFHSQDSSNQKVNYLSQCRW